MPPNEKGLTKRKSLYLEYPKIPSGRPPVPHDDGLLISKAAESFVVESSKEKPLEACSDEPAALHNPDYKSA